VGGAPNPRRSIDSRTSRLFGETGSSHAIRAFGRSEDSFYGFSALTNWIRNADNSNFQSRFAADSYNFLANGDIFYVAIVLH